MPEEKSKLAEKYEKATQFSKEELDRVFNRKHHPWAIDVSLNDTSWVNEYMKDDERYSDVYLTGIGYYNFFSLYTIFSLITIFSTISGLIPNLS